MGRNRDKVLPILLNKKEATPRDSNERNRSHQQLSQKSLPGLDDNSRAALDDSSGRESAAKMLSTIQGDDYAVLGEEQNEMNDSKSLFTSQLRQDMTARKALVKRSASMDRSTFSPERQKTLNQKKRPPLIPKRINTLKQSAAIEAASSQKANLPPIQRVHSMSKGTNVFP